MSQKMPMGAGREMFGALLVLVAVVFFFLALAAGCGGSEQEESNPPPSPEEASRVVVRVSGTEGLAYAGNYGTLTGEPRIVEDALGGEPEEYEVEEIEEGAAEGVSASFQKIEPGAGKLKAEIVADGELVTESTTYAEFGSVIVDWLPQAGPLPEEVFEEPPPEETSP